MSSELDLQTIVDFQQGCGRAFERVYKKYYRPIVIYTIKITNNSQEAEDIGNDVFLKLSKLCSQFECEVKIRAFLYTCARNQCLNYLKAKKRSDEKHLKLVHLLKNDLLLTYDDNIEAEVVKKVHQEIERLPAEMRKVFKLLYMEGLKPAEVAKKLQISVNTVYGQKSKALDILRLKFFPNS